MIVSPSRCSNTNCADRKQQCQLNTHSVGGDLSYLLLLLLLFRHTSKSLIARELLAYEGHNVAAGDGNEVAHTLN